MGVDGGRGHLRMPEQFLDDGELDGLLDTGDGVAVPKPFRRGLGARQGGFLHHSGDMVIAGLPGPTPQSSLRMALPDAVDEIEDVQREQYVTSLPDHNQGCENRLVFAWKQGSKGLALIASPYTMVWIAHLQCIVNPGSKVINARQGVCMSEGTDV
jgi:hypothetical protein